MTLIQIKQAIEEGKNVYWSNIGYKVIKDKKENYLIKHHSGNCIGLTWNDETTLNGKEEDFFIQ